MILGAAILEAAILEAPTGFVTTNQCSVTLVEAKWNITRAEKNWSVTEVEKNWTVTLSDSPCGT